MVNCSCAKCQARNVGGMDEEEESGLPKQLAKGVQTPKQPKVPKVQASTAGSAQAGQAVADYADTLGGGKAVKNKHEAVLNVLRQAYYAVSNAQGRKTLTGQYANHTPKAGEVDEAARMGWGPHERAEFEAPDEELHEDDAASQLVGTHAKDGRGDTMSELDETGTKGVAGEDDDDGLQGGQLPPSEVPAKKKTGNPVTVTGNVVVVDNEHVGFKTLSDQLVVNEHEGHYFGDKNLIGAADSDRAATASRSANAKGTKAAHETAAKAHKEASKVHLKAGNVTRSDHHVAAAFKHQAKAKIATNIDSSYTNPTGAPTMEPHDMSKQAASATVHTDHEPAAGPAMKAVKASKAGNSEKASDFHEQAADLHQEAATAARKKGDHEEANLHDNAAAMHSKAASMHDAACTTNRRTVTMTRNQAIRLLTANCRCQQDVAALNGLKNETLAVLLRNAKMDSSNADASGGGTEQAGGEEDDPDGAMEGAESKKGKGLEGGPKVGDKGVIPKFSGKSDATENFDSWLQKQHPEAQQFIRHAQEVTNREKAAIVRSITSNTERQKSLMKLTLPQLREQQAIVQEAVANVAQQQTYIPEITDNEDIFALTGNGGSEAPPNYAGSNGFAQTVTDNSYREDDVLRDQPTMNSVIESNASPRLLEHLKRGGGRVA